MFDRLKKVLGAQEKSALTPKMPVPEGPVDPLADWALAQGYSFTGFGEGKGFAVGGDVHGRPWKLECGRSSRDYIRGDELRARAELKANDEVSVLIMNRPLKEALEKKAYQMYTDTLQTTADPSLPEEMRWLAMYPEAGWDSPGTAFWKRYSVLADHKEHAQVWIDQKLVDLLMSWPEPAPDDQAPFMMMVLRGKGYLRMQYRADTPTLEHATRVFTTACENAVSGLSTDISL